MKQPTRDELFAAIERGDIDTVVMAFPDLQGRLVGKRTTGRFFLEQVAEVVRNLAARDRENQLSAAEKTMYERARLNLISEIAPSKRCSTEEATRFLDDALEKGVLSAGGKSQLQELGRASTGGKRKADPKKADAKKPAKPKATSKKK